MLVSGGFWPGRLISRESNALVTQVEKKNDFVVMQHLADSCEEEAPNAQRSREKKIKKEKEKKANYRGAVKKNLLVDNTRSSDRQGGREHRKIKTQVNRPQKTPQSQNTSHKINSKPGYSKEKLRPWHR